MILAQPDSITALHSFVADYKFWVAIVTFIVACYRGFEWVKQLRTKDLMEVRKGVQELQIGIADLGTKLDRQTNSVVEKLEKQTVSLVDELKELRDDFRMLMPMVAYNMAPATSRPTAKRKKQAVKRTGTVAVTVTKDLQSA